MKLRKLVMTGFRSVKSEQTLLVDERVTILIGANDHGKSNLLEAIQCLNDDKPIATDDKNWDTDENSPVELRWHFAVDGNMLDQLRELVAKVATAAPAETSAIPVTPPGATIQAAALAKATAPVDVPTPPETDQRTIQPSFTIGAPNEIVYVRDSGANKVRVAVAPFAMPASSEQFLLAMRPRVEMFASPSGNVVDQVNLRQLESEEFEFMQGIFRLAGLWDSRQSIFAQNDRTSRSLDEASETLTRILKDDWNQGKELKWKLGHAGTNGDHIVITIQDPAITGSYTRPSLRSSGFRTYFLLSMIIYARTQSKPSDSHIYLFDEPGTYLHPSAQLDLQRSFEAVADQAQILYTTHSLFLVSKNYPTRNRVVNKTTEGTKIDLKPFSKNWKSVRNSLGILLSNNFLIAEKTLLVEGPSDVIYLLDAARQLKRAAQLDIDLNDLSIVDAGDAQNFLAMAKLMLSEGREIVALLDGDAAGKKVEAHLRRLCSSELTTKKLQIHLLPDNKSSEDIFANFDMLKDAVRAAYDELIASGVRIPREGLDIDAELTKFAAVDGDTLGRTLDQETKNWFKPQEKISKLIIALKYEDKQGAGQRLAPERAATELRAIKQKLNLRGEKSQREGAFGDTV